MDKIKDKLPYFIRRSFRKILHIKEYVISLKKNKINEEYYRKIKDKKKIFIISSPTHSNLGDHAIAYSQREFLKEIYWDYKFIEIDTYDVVNHIKAIKKNINKDDIFTFPGGGNFGNMYFVEEEARRVVINNIKNNYIILFPQTIDFNNSVMGRKELEITKKIYSKNKQLILVAREKISYNIIKENFTENIVLLTPDIVLTLNKTESNVRDGALICMRNDLESVIDKNAKDIIIDTCKLNYKNIKVTDTVLEHNVSFEDRLDRLQEKWNEFSQSEVVVTDRLHGMIFACITSTPCVVFSNSNHKVKGTYEWIKNFEYIKFIEDNNKLEQAILEVTGQSNQKYDNVSMKKNYEELIEILLKIKN